MDVAHPSPFARTPGRIIPLPEMLINQLKAGEVVESLGSLIKELMENALDAGATHLILKYRKDLLSELLFTDNGQGFLAEDIPMAFTRHATSKIQQFTDLFNLHSYGFRGEALAAIAAISDLTLETKVAKDELISSYHLPYQQFERAQVERKTAAHLLPSSFQTPQASGSCLQLKKLFAQTPARLKFFQQLQGQKQALERLWHAYALLYPEIIFERELIDQELYEYFPRSSSADRTAQLFQIPKEHLLSKTAQYDSLTMSITTLASTAKIKRGMHKKQFIFVNQRLVDIHDLKAQLLKALPGLHSFALYITTDPAEVDVNVHPNKMQVKFERKHLLWGLLHQLISELKPLALAAPVAPAPVEVPTEIPTETNHHSPTAVPAAPQLLPSLPRLLWINPASSIYLTPARHQCYQINPAALLEQWKQPLLGEQYGSRALFIPRPFYWHGTQDESEQQQMLITWREQFQLQASRLNAERILIEKIPLHWTHLPLEWWLNHVFPALHPGNTGEVHDLQPEQLPLQHWEALLDQCFELTALWHRGERHWWKKLDLN